MIQTSFLYIKVLFILFYQLIREYTTFTVSTKYWLYSQCCAGHTMVCTSYFPCPHNPPFPLVTTGLLSVSVNLMFFVIFTGLLYFLDCTISDIIQYFVFASRCISLSIMPSKLVHVTVGGKISFSFIVEYYSMLPNCGAGEDS